MRHRRIVVFLLGPALLLQSAGCYRHVPVEHAVPQPRTHVALQLTDRASLDLAPRIGALVERVEGAVVEAGDSTVVLAMTATIDRRGMTTSWTGEAVEFRRDQVASMRERKLSRTRSWLLAAGIVALAVAAAGIGGAFGGEERGSEGSPQ